MSIINDSVYYYKIEENKDKYSTGFFSTSDLNRSNKVGEINIEKNGNNNNAQLNFTTIGDKKSYGYIFSSFQYPATSSFNYTTNTSVIDISKYLIIQTIFDPKTKIIEIQIITPK